MFKRHVGVQELFFQITGSHAWLRFRSLSLPSLPLHTTTQSGCCRRQATYGFIQKKNVMMNWRRSFWLYCSFQSNKLLPWKDHKSVHCVVRGEWWCVCLCLSLAEGERSQRNNWICDKTSGDLTYIVISLQLDNCFLPLDPPGFSWSRQTVNDFDKSLNCT